MSVEYEIKLVHFSSRTLDKIYYIQILNINIEYKYAANNKNKNKIKN